MIDTHSEEGPELTVSKYIQNYWHEHAPCLEVVGDDDEGLWKGQLWLMELYSTTGNHRLPKRRRSCDYVIGPLLWVHVDGIRNLLPCDRDPGVLGQLFALLRKRQPLYLWEKVVGNGLNHAGVFVICVAARHEYNAWRKVQRAMSWRHSGTFSNLLLTGLLHMDISCIDI